MHDKPITVDGRLGNESESITERNQIIRIVNPDVRVGLEDSLLKTRSCCSAWLTKCGRIRGLGRRHGEIRCRRGQGFGEAGCSG